MLILSFTSLFRHLNGTVLQSFVRPAVLITDAYNALYTNQTQSHHRDTEFLGWLLAQYLLYIISSILLRSAHVQHL